MTMISRELSVNHLRLLVSSADFMIGEELDLRADMGGGRWRVVELLPRVGTFARCIAEPIETPIDIVMWLEGIEARQVARSTMFPIDVPQALADKLRAKR